jgi:hypothetical protein
MFKGPLKMSSEFMNAHALVVGIAGYKQVTSLPEAVLNDARDIASVLTSRDHCGFDPRRVHLLLDSDATLERIKQGLEDIVSTAEPDSSVVVFFSGHGALLGGPSETASALIPFDCSLGALEATSLSEREFSSILQRIQSRRLLVLLDACHSGDATRFKTSSEAPNHISFGYSEKSLSMLATGVGRVLMASSRATEESLVLARSPNSLFTTHLLEALRGEGVTQGDGLIRVFDIFNHVAQRVPAGSGQRQHPIFKASDLEDNFPIALNHGGTKRVSPLPTPDMGIKRDEWKTLEEIMANLYPSGPIEQEIWSRSGGDLSRLKLGSTGRTNWFNALRTLRQGGGGSRIDLRTLIGTALEDYPHHVLLLRLLTCDITAP